MNWIQQLFSKKEDIKQCDTLISEKDNKYLIRQQELEDFKYYNQVKAEAIRQINNKNKGWIVDISRANIARTYTIYNEDTAKYKNVNPLDLCMEIINKLS